MFFYGFSGFQVSLFGSRMFFYGFSRFQVGFLLFQVGFYGFSRFQVSVSWFQVGFQGFPRFRIGFSRFQVGYEGKSWLQVGFIVTGRYFMVPGGFSCFFYGSRSGFHDARWICIVINGPRLDYFGAERHRPEVRKPKRYSLGLAGRRPALA